jgi:hypothetical protein
MPTTEQDKNLALPSATRDFQSPIFHIRYFNACAIAASASGAITAYPSAVG